MKSKLSRASGWGEIPIHTNKHFKYGGNTMKIITKAVGEHAVTKKVEKLELADMQSLVDGLIQPVYLGKEIICWCNEEGKLNNMDVNLALASEEDGTIVDTIHGNIFFTNEAEGDEGLNPKQIELLLEQLNNGVFTFTYDMNIVPVILI